MVFEFVMLGKNVFTAQHMANYPEKQRFSCPEKNNSHMITMVVGAKFSTFSDNVIYERSLRGSLTFSVVEELIHVRLINCSNWVVN